MIGNNIDILCLQEVEIDKDYDYHALNLNNYCLEIEHNTIKSRVGMFVGNKMKWNEMKYGLRDCFVQSKKWRGEGDRERKNKSVDRLNKR